MAVMSCRLGHDTKHFNVGQYRRVQKTTSEIQNASFFDPNNEVGPAYSKCAMTPISLTSLSPSAHCDPSLCSPWSFRAGSTLLQDV